MLSGHWHGYMYEDRGEMASTFIVCFALSSAVAGFTSGSFYRYHAANMSCLCYFGYVFFNSQVLPHHIHHHPYPLHRQYFASARAEQNSQWQKAMFCTCLFFPSIVVAVVAMLNNIAIYYDTVSAIPAMVIVKMVAVWLFVSLPLTVVGTIFGRHFCGKPDIPCRVNSIPR